MLVVVQNLDAVFQELEDLDHIVSIYFIKSIKSKEA